MILGITGPSGSGKTTLLTLLRDYGGAVLDCDEIYHELLQTDAALLARLAAAFPAAFEGGVLQRRRLGKLVFADPAALARLNEITHAAVKAEVERRLLGRQSAAIDAIALFESGLAPLCDTTVAVVAPEEARLARLMARDSIPESYARSRMAAQHEEGWFRARCDHVLEIRGDYAQFREECLAFLKKLGIIAE